VAKKKWIVWNGAGDWMNPDFPGNQHVVPTPMTTMPAWYYYAKVVSQTAALLGKPADAAKYAAIAEDVKKRFNADFFHPETGMYGNETNNQTAQILPVALGMVPDGKEKQAYDGLLNTIHARNDHIGTGFVSLPWLLQTLASHRESALANKMVNQKDFPSWNTLITEGVLKEGWEGGNAQMPSTGGSIGGWLFRSVLGIQPDPAGPGFKKFILSPQPDPATGLTYAKGYYDSIYGRIGSDWKLDGGKFTFKASIPVNTTATVIIPTSDPKSVMESGLPAAQAPGVKFVRTEGAGANQTAVYQVASGEYHFTANQAL
jgi:alpha-L-rhamnosidase